VATDTPSGRVVALGWHCDVRDRTLFATRRAPLGSAAGAAEMAAELARRYPCAH